MNCCNKIHLVYVLVDGMGTFYVGISSRDRIKNRFAAHKRSRRFSLPICIDVIYESADRQHIEDMEEFFIKEFDTYFSGGNQTKSGKGNHLARTFTTLGYTFSDDSKRKMSETRKKLFKDGKLKKIPMTQEQKNKMVAGMLAVRKGKRCYDRLSKDVLLKIIQLYETKPVLGDEYLLKGEGDGVFFSYESAFISFMCERFSVSSWLIKNVLRNSTYKNQTKHPNGKLSIEDVEFIRNSFKDKTIPLRYVKDAKVYKNYERAFSTRFCSDFGVTHVTIYNVITRHGRYSDGL